DALGHPDLGQAVGSPAARRLAEVARLFAALRPMRTLSPPACLAGLIAEIRYREYLLEENPVEARERIENVDELIAGAETYLRRAEDPTVDGFLAEVALLTDVDLWNDEGDTVNPRTTHSATGLEFPGAFGLAPAQALVPP